MQFGIRDCTDLVFRSTDTRRIGRTTFKKGQPVLYIDSAKTSTLEGAGTTVYATGGRGNTRLLTWEGEKTLTFTVEDALLSPIGFAILSGAGLFDETTEQTHFHQTAKVNISGGATSIDHYYKWDTTTEKYIEISKPSKEVLDFLGTDGLATITGETAPTSSTLQVGAADYAKWTETTSNSGFTIDLTDALGSKNICADAPVYISILEDDSIVGTATFSNATAVDGVYTQKTFTIRGDNVSANGTAIVDYYVLANENKAMELQIDAENFAGYFYVEANTLVKRRSDGKDLPAVITIPMVKIQSNFSIAFASSGDPSTFTFTMDAMPAYTYFNKTKKVLCVFQIFEDEGTETDRVPVMREIEYHDNEVGNTANGN